MDEYILEWTYKRMNIYTNIWLYTDVIIYMNEYIHEHLIIYWGKYIHEWENIQMNEYIVRWIWKGWWVSFFGYKLGSGSEKAGGAGREARKSMEVGLAGLYLFLPAPPCPSKAGRKISLSYTMTYEGFLPASPASPILITLIFYLLPTYPTYPSLLFYIKTN